MISFYRFNAAPSAPNDIQQVERIQQSAQEAMDALNSILEGSFNRMFRERKRRDYGLKLIDVIRETEKALRMEFTDEEVGELSGAFDQKPIARVDPSMRSVAWHIRNGDMA